MKNYKLIRTATVPVSLDILLRGQLLFLSNSFEVIAVSSTGKELEEVQNRENVNVHSIEMKRGIAPIKDIYSLISLYRYFKKEKPLIIHSITPKAGLLSMIAGKLAKVPIRMHTFTGLIFPTKSGLTQRLLICMDKILCFFATNLYPEGQGVKNDLINYGITKKDLKVIANGNVNGIDVSYFDAKKVSDFERLVLRNELGINDRCIVFIFVGRLVGDKGINELIEAFDALEYRNVRLLLVGAFESAIDPLRGETVKTINSNEKISHVGFQNDVRKYFAISDCLLFPSYREGFPNVVLQAGAMGLPSIVSNINGCNEIIIEGVNGAIIPPRNINCLKSAMSFLIDNPAVLKEMKMKSRALVVERYEQKYVWDCILTEYKRLIKDYEQKAL